MNPNEVLQLLFDANRLKLIPRIGWQLRGVRPPESVAEHSFGVAFVALVLAEHIEPPLDRGRLLTIALLHDLSETLVTDLPSSAIHFLSPPAKQSAEEQAIAHLLGDFPFGDEYRDLWREFEERSSTEGRLVRDADKLEMMIQALVYERDTASRNLGEFWERIDDYPFDFEISRTLYHRLREMRHS